jgi:hypothetical protein
MGQPRATSFSLQTKGTEMSDKYFIERRDDGQYKVLKPSAERASAIAPTQADAISRARAMNPEATIHIERVRNVGPGRDKWRT